MISSYQELRPTIDMLKSIVNSMKKVMISGEDLNSVLEVIEEINTALYGVSVLKFQGKYNLESEQGYSAFVGELEALIEIWESSVCRMSTGTDIDRRFWNIYEKFKYVMPDDLYAEVMKRFFSLSEGQRIEYLSLGRRYTFLNNGIDITSNDYSLIIEYIEMMVSNIEKYKFLYEHLADYKSKYILLGIIEYWFGFNLDKLHRLTENIYLDYYDLDIIHPNDEEVLVDLGAYTGDSIHGFLNTYGAYKRIYAYELTPGTFDTLKENVGGLENIELRQKGGGSENAIMYVENNKNGVGNKILESGDTPVEIVSLDSDISERITLIKMDIEGAEKDAIIGAKNHILNEKPQMMISAYHLPADIFNIPILINEIRDDYRFYLRFYGHGCVWPCDYVLFAV